MVSAMRALAWASIWARLLLAERVSTELRLSMAMEIKASNVMMAIEEISAKPFWEEGRWAG